MADQQTVQTTTTHVNNPLYCSTCKAPTSEPLVCADCRAVICRVCGTVLEKIEELGIG